MATIYLVRHGENPANLTREFSHRLVDYSLTPKGIRQAQQVAAYFRTLPIDQIFSSPLKRARETAEIIGAEIGLPVTVSEAFREINVGTLEGQQPTDELWAFHDGIFRAWFEGRRETAFPEGEDHHTLAGRMHAGLLEVIGDNPDGRSIVVGHGGIFTATIAQLCPDCDILTIVRQGNRNCSVTEIEAEVRDGVVYGSLVRWADGSHLSDEH
jgi:broad specificity phosphatase PhoE